MLDYTDRASEQKEEARPGEQMLSFFTPGEPAVRPKGYIPPAPFTPAGQKGALLLSEDAENCTEEPEDVQAKLAGLEKAINYYRSSGKTGRPKLAESLQQLGSLYQDEGNHKEALRHYEESLSLLQQMPPSEAASPKAQALKQLGSLHYELQHLPEALQYFEAALNLTEEQFTPQSDPAKLEASAIAILSAALRIATGEQAGTNGRSASQFITLAERYLKRLGQEGHLVKKRMEELKYTKRVLEGLLEG